MQKSNNIFFFHNNIPNNLFIRFFLLFIFINSIDSQIKRKDTEPEQISGKYFKLIQNNFKGNSNENNTFTQNFDEYTVTMKYLSLNLKIESNQIEEHMKEIGRYIFTYVNPFVEFILSFEISNNNNYTNIPSDTVFITFGQNLKFEIKNIYAYLDLSYIEFERNTNHSYSYKINEYGDRKIDIFIDIEKFKYISKIYNFLNGKKEQLNKFLYHSFCKYLYNIVSKYPIADGLYFYYIIKERLLDINTFGLDLDEDKDIEKISINYFEEEKYILDPQIKFINIKTEFELTFKNNKETTKYSEIIPEIYLFIDEFEFYRADTIIGNTTLSAIFDKLFKKIIWSLNND